MNGRTKVPDSTAEQQPAKGQRKDMRRKNKKIDMLNGSIWDKMIVFALPLAFTGMLQQLFNAADVAVLGRFVSNESMAGVVSTRTARPSAPQPRIAANPKPVPSAARPPASGVRESMRASLSFRLALRPASEASASGAMPKSPPGLLMSTASSKTRTRTGMPRPSGE